MPRCRWPRRRRRMRALPWAVLCWPIADPLARYRMVKEKGNTPPRRVARRLLGLGGRDGRGQPAGDRRARRGRERCRRRSCVQGLADDNVTPDMADRFAAAYRAHGGSIELHKFDGPAAYLHPARPGERRVKARDGTDPGFRAGEGSAVGKASPSPSHRFATGPSLSRNAGEGLVAPFPISSPYCGRG